MTFKEPPQRADADPNALRGKAGTDLGQGDVAVVVEHRPDQFGVRVRPEMALVTPRLSGNGPAMRKPHLTPVDRRRHPDPASLATMLWSATLASCKRCFQSTLPQGMGSPMRLA